MPRGELARAARTGRDADVRTHALLPAPEERDPRLVRHLRAAHLHRVHAPDRGRHKVPRRREAPARRQGRRHEERTR